MIDYELLKIIWWCIFGFLLIAYMVTGGMDIGVSFLLPFIGHTDQERRLVINAIGPTWEGNQVWLITLGAGLFAIWPVAYGTIFSSMYLAFVLVLIMLILRPPGIDYRSKINSHLWRSVWDVSLFSSGLILSLGFGAVIGNLFAGLPFHFDADMRLVYEGTFVSILTPNGLLFGVVTLFMFGLQGALFLQHKLEDAVAQRAKNIVKIFAIGFVCFAVAAGINVVLWVPGYEIVQIPALNTMFMVNKKIVKVVLSGWAQNYANFPWLWIFPISCLIITRLVVRLSQKDMPGRALLLNSLGMACAAITVGCAMFPFILPSISKPNHSLTIWDVCASQLTLQCALIVTILLVPVILLYTAWVYRVMRGKVKIKPESY